MATRGEHLVRGDRGFATGGGVLGRLASPAFERVLDQLHARLARGGFAVTLPDGRQRSVGFHAPGPIAAVDISHWMALVRLAASGSVGWYKAWTLGEWSSPDPVALFELFSANAVELGDAARAKGPFRWLNALGHRLRDNAPGKARANIAAHYDLGNDFYAAWLDATMTYSAARFCSAEESLEQAQQRKIATLLDRLDLQPGQRLLEIGCGWGSLAIAAAERGVDVVGLTLSPSQKAWAEERIAAAGLADRVEIRLQDYRHTA
ncbi:MAG: class I SAM-dependent methyltransferase, partial [Sphingomicrobium sp.]